MMNQMLASDCNFPDFKTLNYASEPILTIDAELFNVTEELPDVYGVKIQDEL